MQPWLKVAVAATIGAVLCGAAALLWLVFAGHHRHSFELRRPGTRAQATPPPASYMGALEVRLRSARSPFSVSTSAEPAPEPDYALGFRGTLHYEAGREAPSAAASDGIGVIHSEQILDLPRGATSCAFSVDGVPFLWTPGRLEGAGRAWEIPAEGLDVDVDALR